MEIRYLGPLEASEGGRTVRLGGPKQRLVLAHMLIRPNEVVPTHRLIEDIWGNDPPPAARNSLHSYISHLRGALGADRIESHGDGYLLRIDDEEVDALRFEALAGSGHRLLGHDPGAAAETLAHALELWRGTPFANGSLPRSLQLEADRLEQLRIAVVEDRMEADLATGDHTQLTGELDALTAAHPLRERLWGQLMLALYRSGRQAEALAAFDRARLLLSEELGIDPSPDLQRLHGRILRQDPGLQLEVTALRGYRLLERLGSSRSAVVWRGTQPGTDREVAVKAFHAQFANDAAFIRNFEARVHAFSRVEHPHVVPLYDFWREPDGGYIVMRLLRGGSLRSVLDRSGRLRSGAARRTAEQVTQALAAVHQQGLLHAGVSASNVLLDERGNAYLAEPDIVRQARANTVTSRDHALPDGQVEEPLTPATDVRALGVLLAEIIEEPTPAVGAVIARATADDPGDRFTDAQEMVPALCAALAEADAVATTAAAGTGTAPRGTSPVAPAPTEIRNPYKGLRPFTEADLGDFFGREVMAERLLDRLREPGPDARFLAVVGPSGSGKSSVVRAGLVPAIRAGALDATVPWFVVHMAPGAYPYEELEAALLRVAVDPPPSLIEQLERDRLGILRVVKRILPDEQGELVLVIDQFEEIFTLVDDEERRRRFLEALTTALTDPRSRLRVVVTLRADLYDRPLRYRGLADLVHARTEAVVPLTVEELERAITGPAERVGAHIGPGLVARMVSDVTDQPGALPLLQYALTEMFERRRDATIDAASYEAIGGVSGALAKRAEDTYTSLSSLARDAARQFLLRLVVIDDGDTGTRCRTLRSELRSLAPNPQHMDVAIDAFGEARLLAFDRDVETRAPTVEVAHEALLREWDRLRAWIDDARDDLRIERRLASAAREWRDAGRDSSFLVSGSRLDQLEAWRDRVDLSLTAVEHEFLAESLAQRAREAAEEEARRDHEGDLERRSMRRLRALVAVLAAAALVAGGLTVLALLQSGRLADQVRITTARELAAAAVANLDVDPERSILLALEAVDTTFAADGTVVREAEEALHRAIKSSRLIHTLAHGRNLAISADGRRFATNGDDGSVVVWDVETATQVLTLSGHEEPITGIDFSPSGEHLATTSHDGTVRVWDAAEGRELVAHAVQDGFTAGPAFSPDGRSLAATGEDGTVRMWDVATGREEIVLTGSTEAGFTVAFSPDGTHLAMSGLSRSVRIWDTSTGETHRVLTGHDWDVPQVVWSPDGATLATASVDGTVRIWEADSGQEMRTLYGHTSSVNAVAFSPDGLRIATGGWDATVRVWDPHTGQELLKLGGHVSEVTAVVFTPDGDRLLSTSIEGVTRTWDVSPTGSREWLTVPAPPLRYAGVAFSPDGSRLAVPGDRQGVTLRDTDTGEVVAELGGHSATVVRTAFSPDGRWLAGVAGSGATEREANRTVPVWDTRTGRIQLTLAGHEEEVTAVAYSADGSRIVTGSDDGTARVWDALSGAEQAVLTPGGDWVFNVGFSPDGRFLVTADGAGVVTVFDADSLEAVRSLDAHDGVVFGMAFAPDGRLVTAGVDGMARVWDVASGQALTTFERSDEPLKQVAVSPDGTRIVTGAEDGTARVWDLDTGRELLAIHGHELLVDGVAFSPDGRLLATSSPDGTVAVHLLPIDELRELAMERVNRNLTDQECRQYLRVDACPAAVDR